MNDRSQKNPEGLYIFTCVSIFYVFLFIDIIISRSISEPKHAPSFVSGLTIHNVTVRMSCTHVNRLV